MPYRSNNDNLKVNKGKHNVPMNRDVGGFSCAIDGNSLGTGSITQPLT